MSQQNLDVIRDQLAATNERDWKRVMGHYADDVELEVPTGIRSGTFRGLDAVGEWFGDWFRSFDQDAHFEIEEITEVDDDGVLVVTAHQASGRGSGVRVEMTFIWLYRLREGKITRVQGFDSREQAREAVGLSE
jgi:ketosteroid isomerase-like protein